MAYDILSVDLGDGPFNRRRITAPGSPQISSVTCLSLPGSATDVLLHLDTQSGIPILVQGIQFKVNPVCDERTGEKRYPYRDLFITTTVARNGALILLVTYGEAGLIEVTGGGASTTLPVRGGYIGTIRATFNDTAPSGHFLQMQNPATSGRTINIRQLWASINSAIIWATHRTTTFRGSTPAGVAASPLDSENTAPSVLVFTSGTGAVFWPGAASTDAEGDIVGFGEVAGVHALQSGPLAEPITLNPGQAYEWQKRGATEGGGIVWLGGIWDEG